MDLESVRSFLPSMTRERVGELVVIRPMREGKMGAAVADPERAVQLDVPGRMDFSPDIEQLGGGRERPQAARVVSAHASISFAISDLSLIPRSGDMIERSNPQTGTIERYRIHGDMHPVGGAMLFLLSRIS